VLNIGGNLTAPYGWIHSPNPLAYILATNTSIAFNDNPLLYLNLINHNPLDLGDNLPAPGTQVHDRGTWWGFPTWRETLSLGWKDPTWQINLLPHTQPAGLSPRSSLPPLPVADDANLLPPMATPLGYSADFSFIRRKPDNYADGLGSLSAFWAGTAPPNNVDPLWSQSWEDDLIMTNVRSFDIKAYDDSKGDYVDLGWGDDMRVYQPYVGLPNAQIPPTPPGLLATPPGAIWPPFNPTLVPSAHTFDTLRDTFAHEGRMPPLFADLRLDAQYPNPTYNVYNQTWTPQYAAYPTYSSNIGDDQPGIVRLRRVWDSWSTDYTRAPATGVYKYGPLNGFPVGPPFSPPVYPSYPPPYPAPLRGIQIQIRVTDPTNQRIKVLTIKQDFTDKL
jgi:hypothetical protein